MRKVIIPGVLLLCVLLMAACGNPTGSSSVDHAAGGLPANSVALPAEVTLLCRIVDGAADGDLLLAEQGENRHGVYLLPVEGLGVTLDGKAATAADLQDGMLVEVFYDGMVLESFPGRLPNAVGLAAATPDGGGLTDLCGLYLQVLEDLWGRDSGLNSDISMIGLDLSDAPGDLSPAEKSAIAYRFGQSHGLPTVEGTWDELVEQGYITGTPLGNGAPENAKFYEWKDGCLFSISANTQHTGEAYSLPTLFFDAEKWRSVLGAYFFSDCSVVWPEFGPWTGYNIGGEMIS